MKRLTITETILSNVELDDLHLDKVASLLSVENCNKYQNVRFTTHYEGDYEDATKIICIIGDRLETLEEAKKRIEAKKKERDKKRMAKMSKIERLETELAKLKGKKS